jgi:hypothetical protein
MKRAAGRIDEPRSPGVAVLQYILLAVTLAGVVLCFLTVHGAFVDVLAAAFSGTSGLTAEYRRSLLDKAIMIVLGIGGMTAVLLCDWYYGRARSVWELLQRFAGVVTVIGLLLSASHAVVWLVGERNPTTLLLAAGELTLGAALFVLAKVKKRK